MTDATAWKLVPVEPTQEQVRDAYKDQPGAINAGFAQAYRTMLAAAPIPSPLTDAENEWNKGRVSKFQDEIRAIREEYATAIRQIIPVASDDKWPQRWQPRVGRMIQIETLIGELKDTAEKFGNTCVYVTGLSWGAVALNYQGEDQKHYGCPDCVKGKVDGAECPTCHGTNHRTVPAIRALSFAPPPKDLLTQMFLDEFSKKNYCCLCGNYGVIDTRGKMFTPAGFECGDKVFCVCPNGRGWKNGGADLDKLPASAPPPATAQPRSEEGGGASDADIERVARALWHAAGCDRHSDFDKPSYPAGPDNIRNLARHAIAAYLTTVQQKEK